MGTLNYSMTKIGDTGLIRDINPCVMDTKTARCESALNSFKWVRSSRWISVPHETSSIMSGFFVHAVVAGFNHKSSCPGISTVSNLLQKGSGGVGKRKTISFLFLPFWNFFNKIWLNFKPWQEIKIFV